MKLYKIIKTLDDAIFRMNGSGGIQGGSRIEDLSITPDFDFRNFKTYGDIH